MSDERTARAQVDELFRRASKVVCDNWDAHICAHLGAVIRGHPLKVGHGFADYMRNVDSKPVSVIEREVCRGFKS